MVARMAPGTDRAALAAQLEPLARRVQQRLGGPAALRANHGASPAGGEAAPRAAGRQDRDAAVDSARHGRHRLPHRVRERGQPVHGAGGEPAPRPGGAARARRRTRRSGALAGGRGTASRGSGRRGRRAHRVGRRPTPGPRGAGCGRRRFWRRTHSRTRHRGPGPPGAALHGGHLGSGGVRVRRAARLPLLGLASGQPPAGRTRRRRPPESHARRAGGRANRFRPRAAGRIGAAHAQLLAAQRRRRRVRHEGHLHIPDRAQPPRAERPDVRLAVSVRVHGSPEGAAGRRIRRVHHHASAGRGRGHPEHHHSHDSWPVARRRLSSASRAPAARTSRRWGSSS